MNDTDILDLVRAPSGWNARAEAASIARAYGFVPYRVFVLGPEDHRDEEESRIAAFGGREAYARHQALLALHESGIATELRNAAGAARHLSRLLQERVARPGAELLDVDEAARLLNLSRRALYRELQRHPERMPALAVVRVGSRLRFDRSALEEAIRGRSSGLNSRPRSRLIGASRVPSPRKVTT
jgi:excisionase family DNA binding protein